MNFVFGEKEPYMPAYIGPYDPLVSYAISNRSIGLLFGPRVRTSMLWKARGYVKDTIVLIDDSETEHLLTTIPNVKELSLTFDYLAFPLLAVQVEAGVQVYYFDSIGGDEMHRHLLVTIPGARNPRFIPTNVSDLGSVLNQPVLFYVSEDGDLETRSYKDSFQTLQETVAYNLLPTDELRKVGITRTGKVQIEISKIKLVP